MGDPRTVIPRLGPEVQEYDLHWVCLDPWKWDKGEIPVAVKGIRFRDGIVCFCAEGASTLPEAVQWLASLKSQTPCAEPIVARYKPQTPQPATEDPTT